MVSHDVVKASQQAQAGTDLHVHGAVHVVEQVQGLVNQLTALLQKTCKTMSLTTEQTLGGKQKAAQESRQQNNCSD